MTRAKPSSFKLQVSSLTPFTPIPVTTDQPFSISMMSTPIPTTTQQPVPIPMPSTSTPATASTSTATTTQQPAYAYVFPYDLPIPPLRELDDEAQLSKLHTKFWNQSIDDEESTWAGAHGTLPETDESDIVRGCSPSRLISPISESQNFGFVKNTYGSMTSATVTTRILTGNRIFPPVPSSQGNPALVSASPHRLHIFKHTYTKKGKHTGSFMPYADASAKADQSFGTLQTTGIYLYEVVFSNTVNSPTSIPQYLLLSSGRLSMRTNVH